MRRRNFLGGLFALSTVATTKLPQQSPALSEPVGLDNSFKPVTVRVRTTPTYIKMHETIDVTTRNGERYDIELPN